MENIKQWFNRVLTNPEALALLGTLLFGLLAILWVGELLSPVLASIVIAYLLEGVVAKFQFLGLSRKLAVISSFSLFMALLSYMIFGLIPLLSIQTVQLAQQLPNMLNQGVHLFTALPEKYPNFITEAQVKLIFDQVSTEAVKYGQNLLSFSAASVLNVVALIVYLLLVPMMVFFFLMDKAEISQWFASFLPTNRRLTIEVWSTVNEQIANYVRGKVC